MIYIENYIIIHGWPVYKERCFLELARECMIEATKEVENIYSNINKLKEWKILSNL